MSGTTQRTPVVSVVIPCGGDSATLPLQLAALASQTTAPEFEVVVVNNGAPGELDGLPAAHPDLPYPLRVVEAVDRRGSSYARNVGAREARSELLMFCDADDVVSSSWVHHGRRAFAVTPVWSGVALALPDGEFGADPAEVQARIDPTGEEGPPLADTQEHPTVLLGGNFGITRRAFVELGGFDVSVAHHGDDNDLCARVRAAGQQVPHVLSARIAYRQTPGVRAACRQAFADSRAAQLLQARTAPPVPGPRALARAAALAARAPLFPLGMLARRRWEPAALFTRWCHVLGTVDGLLRYGVLRRVPPRDLGVGLGPSRPKDRPS